MYIVHVVCECLLSENFRNHFPPSDNIYLYLELESVG